MKYALFVIGLVGLVGVAAAQDDRRDRSEPQPTFSEQEKRAFDRSGRFSRTEINEHGNPVTRMNGSQQMVTVARRGPDGNIETFCTGSESEALAFLAGEDVLNRGGEKPQ